MTNDKSGIDINAAAREIASKLIDELNLSNASITSDNTRRSVCDKKVVCSEKECDSPFHCFPAKTFECNNFKG